MGLFSMSPSLSLLFRPGLVIMIIFYFSKDYNYTVPIPIPFCGLQIFHIIFIFGYIVLSFFILFYNQIENLITIDEIMNLNIPFNCNGKLCLTSTFHTLPSETSYFKIYINLITRYFCFIIIIHPFCRYDDYMSNR